ncbi:hypothetical protein D3C81_1596930 [compost metagenome]
MHQVDQVLLVDTVETTVVIAGGQFGGPLVTASTEQKLITGLDVAQHNVASAAIEHGHLLVIRGVALVDPIDAPQIERQVFHLVAIEPGTPEGLWQQATVITHQGRQHRLQRAEFESALGGAQLGSKSSFAVLVLGPSWGFTITLEDAGADPVRAGIELDAEQAYRIDAHADRAVGVTRLNA